MGELKNHERDSSNNNIATVGKSRLRDLKNERPLLPLIQMGRDDQKQLRGSSFCQVAGTTRCSPIRSSTGKCHLLMVGNERQILRFSRLDSKRPLGAPDLQTCLLAWRAE